MKKILSLLFAFLLIFMSMVPAFAAPAEGHLVEEYTEETTDGNIQLDIIETESESETEQITDETPVETEIENSEVELEEDTSVTEAITEPVTEKATQIQTYISKTGTYPITLKLTSVSGSKVKMKIKNISTKKTYTFIMLRKNDYTSKVELPKGEYEVVKVKASGKKYNVDSDRFTVLNTKYQDYNCGCSEYQSNLFFRLLKRYAFIIIMAAIVFVVYYKFKKNNVVISN